MCDVLVTRVRVWLPSPCMASWAVTHGTIWLPPENSDAPLSEIPFPAAWLHSCCSLSNCCDLRSGTVSALGSGSEWEDNNHGPWGRSITPLNSTTTTPAHQCARSVFVGQPQREGGRSWRVSRTCCASNAPDAHIPRRL